jgi:outer membrane protein TolC
MTLDAFLAPSRGGLTSDQAALAAERTTYDAAQRRQELAAADAKVDEAMVAYYPKLALTAAYQRLSPVRLQTIDVPTTAGGTTSLPIPVVLNTYNLQATLTVPISDYVLRLSQSYASASRNRRASVINEQAARLNAALDGRSAYYSWVRARAQVFVAQRALEQARAHLEDAKHAFDVGTASKADVLLVEAQVANNELLVEQAKNAATLTAAQLKTIMHDGSKASYEIGEDIRVELPPMELGELTTLQAEAMDKRLEIRALDETAWSFREQAKVARAAYYPRLDGTADLIYANPNQRFFFPDGEFHPSWALGVRLTWTPNDAFTGKGTAAEAEARALQTDLQKAALRDSIGIEVLQAVQGVRESEFATQTNKRAFTSAREGFRVRRELFRNGRATSVELTDAELELTRAALNLVNVQANLLYARVKLLHVVGRDTPPPDSAPAR